MDFDAEIVRLLPWLRWQARRYCRSREDAEDLVSDTILRVLSARERFDGKDLRSLCFITMKRLYINRSQKKDDVIYSGQMDVLPNVGYSRADDCVHFHDALRILRRAKQVSVCIDCVIDYASGYSYEEIGLRYGLSTGTVGQRIARGRKLLARVLCGKR